MVVVINQFTLKGSPEEFEKAFKQMSEFVSAQPGYLGHTLVRSKFVPNSYVNISRWSDSDSFMASMEADKMPPESLQAIAAVADADPRLYAVVADAGAV